jgi:hypothetical protein
MYIPLENNLNLEKANVLVIEFKTKLDLFPKSILSPASVE